MSEDPPFHAIQLHLHAKEEAEVFRVVGLRTFAITARWIGLRDNLQPDLSGKSPLFSVDFPLNQSIDLWDNYEKIWYSNNELWETG